MRVESSKRLRNGGYLHRLRDDTDWRATRGVRRIVIPTNTHCEIDFAQLAERFAKAVNAGALAEFAQSLGVSAESLQRLFTGWDGAAWTFPMVDALGRVVGIRRRLPNSRKLSVTGGREGLFVPTELPMAGTLFICEGPTDTAALLSVGLATIGRSSCRGGVQYISKFCRGRETVIVADGDTPGQIGAVILAQTLRLVCPSVHTIRPPDGVKDARAWVQRGATAAGILQAVDAVEAVRTAIRSVVI